ncbi:MAG: hypothetical protein AAFQ62_05670 [Pseudomonadota bacterium]
MIRHLVALTLALFTLPAMAGIEDANLPPDTAWYFHVDFKAMRSTSVGQKLYGWLDNEVFDDVREETGFNPNQELDSISAFSDTAGVATMIVQGDVSQDTRDKILAALQAGGDLSTGKASGFEYYEVQNVDLDDAEIGIQSDTLFMSFDRRSAIVVSSTLDGMERGLEARPRKSSGKALLVLAADKSLMQAGVDTMALGDGAASWNSGLLREAREVAFVLADTNGDADIQVRVTADDPRTTNSLAAVVRGLIGLQALSGDVDPNVSTLLSSLDISADSAGLTLALRVSPDVLTDIIND